MKLRSSLALRQRILPLLVLLPSLACGVAPEEDAQDPFRKIVDISRDEKALAEYLKPIPPKEPEEALKSFQTEDGFTMELVAHEPLVYDPVAAAFDENGRLYVAEMRDYPYQPGPGEKPIGVVRLLEDTDGDGRFDKSHDFAEELLWPTGVAVWKGGVFVTAPPDIWYLKDTDGDHKADVRKKMFTGFGHQNEQQMMNNIIWGVDHKIYGIASGNGGSVRRADRPDAEPVSLLSRDFRFDPMSGEFETTTQTFQFGHCFDDWYNRFVCNQGMPGRHVVLPARYLERNPHLFLDLHKWLASGYRQVNPLAEGQTRVYKISPVERWRTIREARRIFAGSSGNSAGVGHHYLTAGSGMQIYRGHAYPEKYRGSFVIGANTANLIHRRVLVPEGVTFTSRRGEKEDTEFVRSTDNWFRPVNSLNAPDGTFYVLDMSRELIEATHVPGRVMKHLDFTHGRDRGRIYRLAPPNFKSPPPPRLGEADTKELVSTLEHPGGWWRDTAHRLIYERQDPVAVPLLRRLFRESANPLARMHALWSLKGMGALQDSDLTRGLDDSSSGVRTHAVRLAESRVGRSPRLFQKVMALTGDEDPGVRLRVALALGESKDRGALPGLARIAQNDVGDFWIRNAVLSSCAEFGDRLFETLTKQKSFLDDPASAEWLSQLAQAIGARNVSSEIGRVMLATASRDALADNPETQRDIVAGLAQGLLLVGKSLTSLKTLPPEAARMIENLMERSRRVASDAGSPEDQRLETIRFLSHGTLERAKEALTPLIEPKQPQAVQVAAIDALTNFDDSEIASILLGAWPSHSPQARSKVLESLMSRQPWTRALLKAVEEEHVTASQIDLKRRDLMMNHDDEAIREQAVRLFGSQAPGPRQAVLDDYQAALTLKGHKERGEEVYDRECIKCHRLSSREHQIGPNLIRGSEKDPESLLKNILDPNRFVEPQYLSYVVTDQRGGLYTGILSEETSTSITLVEGQDLSNTLQRKDIKEIRATGNSLMPEGLEESISKQEMADLISFILAYQYEVGTESAGLAPGEEVYEEMELHPSLRQGGQSSHPNQMR
jgi:putative membrane-bound dehydrogenase-like protein